MIKTIDQITINGSNKAWNGYIYAFDYAPSFGQAASYTTINFISEDGTYNITQSDLNVLSAHTIQVGSNLTLQMYPVSYKTTRSPSGRILEVKYKDTSIVLDKRIVVLNGRQGNDGTANAPINLDVNQSLDYPNDCFVGSCYIPLGKELLKLNDTYNNVLDVVYTFIELCNGIANNGIVISSDSYSLVQNSNPYYYAGYIGTLRNVLANWCIDLGLSFYWENNQIHFIDLSVPLILDTSVLDSAVQESDTEEVTIDDTVGRVACAFYGQDAQSVEVSNSQSTQISFKCITLSQLGFSPDQINSVKAAYYGEDFFFAYHFLLNTDYGNGVLGIKARTGNDPAAVSYDTQRTYSQYFFVQEDNAIKSLNWKFYSQIAKYVGKFYYRAMTYGDSQTMQFKNGKPEFYDQIVACSTTSIAQFASALSEGDQSLSNFLLDQPYTIPATLFPNGVEGQNPYQNEAGYMFLDMGEPMWFYDNGATPVSAAQALQSLTDENAASYYPVLLGGSPKQYIASLNADQPPNWSQVVNLPGPYATDIIKLYALANVFPESQPNFDIGALSSPEEIFPDKLIDVTITQKVTDTVVKIEEFFRSTTDRNGNTVDCNSDVVKTEMNYRQINNQDLLALGRPGVGLFDTPLFTAYGIQLATPAAPYPGTIDEAFKLFSQNLTFSKSDPTIVRTYSLPYIDLPGAYGPSIGKGLMGLSIRIDDKGVGSTYTYGTRLMQVPSIEAIRTNLEFLNKTNETRFLSYGYDSFGIYGGLGLGASI